MARCDGEHYVSYYPRDRLMTAPHSPLAPFFPEVLKVDFEGKRNDWEGVVQLPFLDEALVKQCIASVPESKLTAAQIAANRAGKASPKREREAFLRIVRHLAFARGPARRTLPRV
jgi:5'-3' exonuclease